jgi:plasminogen activator
MFRFLLLLSYIFLITIQAEENNTKYKVKIGISILNGRSDEFVYRTNGTKLSELNWRFDNVKLLNIAYAKPLGRVNFEVDIFKNITNEKSIMDDYDWLSEKTHPDDWTNWSHHENTTIEDVLKVDLGLKYHLRKFKKINLYVKLGYKHDRFKWVARNNGTYIYTSSDAGSNPETYENNFRDIETTSQNKDKGITYQQYFNSLYYTVGIDDFKPLSKLKIPLTIQAYIQYSNFVSATDEDIHHNRDLKFIEVMEDNGDMINYLFGITYNINKKIDIELNYEENEYRFSRGYSDITRLKTGITGTTPRNTAGIYHKSSMIAIRLVSKF